jgi:hypothetical protein
MSTTVTQSTATAVPQPGKAVAAAVTVFVFLSLIRALGPDDPRDFFIYRLGAELAIRGESPYNIARIREHVARRFPSEDAKDFANNCGYFLPPSAVVVYLPFAMLPWVAAKLAWALVNAVAAYFIARLPLLFREKPPPPPPLVLWAVVPFVLLLNPITPVIVFPVGQTTVVFVGCVAAGLLAIERGMPNLGAALWAIAFVKPHLAMPLVPLAWFLGGARPAMLLVGLVAVLNLLGATIISGSPLFLREYIEFLPQTRDAVSYNRAEINPSIGSWNRLLFVAGGPLIELGLATTLAGYLVWYGLLVGRCAIRGERPSTSWAIAATAAGAVLCSQVLVYERLVLLLAVPWIRDLFSQGRTLRGTAAVVLIGAHAIGAGTVEAATGISCHQPLAVALFALLVLTGPMGKPLPHDR